VEMISCTKKKSLEKSIGKEKDETKRNGEYYSLYQKDGKINPKDHRLPREKRQKY